MSSVLYVIDLEFTQLFASELEKEGRGAPYQDVTMRQIGEFHLITRPDGPDTDHQVRWDDCVDNFLADVEPFEPTRIVILGHKGVFRKYIPKLEQFNVESRIRRAEEALLKQLPQPAPALAIYGFHHERHSEIWRLIGNPRELAVPGTLARLRSIVDDGGGPLGHLSALKHQLMRPFASVRLQLQLDAEQGATRLDPESVQRVRAAIVKGRSKLVEIHESFEITRSFEMAVEKACRLLDQDPEKITSDSEQFNGWIDQINDALDEVRREAR